MAEADLKPMSLVDSTHRIRWPTMTKEEFDNCEFPDAISSLSHTIEVDGKESEWHLTMYPKGDDEDDKDKAMLFLAMDDYNEDNKYSVRYQFEIETPSGCWPYDDSVKELYSRGKYKKAYVFGIPEEEDSEISDTWGHKLCTTQEFSQQFVDDKVIVVATFVIYVEGDGYRDHMEIADEFVDDMRSASSLTGLSDFTIVSGNILFRCHKVILAARSKYFEALFRNEPTKNVLQVEESPGLVKAMLNFINKGVIPKDVHVKAKDLILMSDMYGLDLLTVACEKSLVNNLSPDNALETLLIIDKLKHVSQQEHRQMVLTYIKKEAAKIVKTEDWKKFVQSYPDLITEIVLLNS